MAQAALHARAPLYDEPGRKNLSRALTRLFDHWQLDSEQQLALLGFNHNSRTTLKRYRDGAPLANRRDLLERAGHLLAIHKNLRLIYSRNRQTAYGWMRSPNRDFDERAPIEVVQESGLLGLALVRAYLDRARGR